MQVFKDIFPICSCSIILHQGGALYIPSINLYWIKFSSVSVLVQVFQTRNIYMHFVDGVNIWWLVRQFLFSSTWTSFFLPQPTFSWASYFFLWSNLFFQSQVFQFCGIRHGGDLHYRLASNCSQKEICNLTFSYLSLSSFSFLVLALAAKHRNQVSTKSGTSRDNWYPIGDAIVVMCKISTCQSLIKQYLSSVPLTGRVWHKTFFKVVPGAGREPTRVQHSQKCLGPRRHSPKKGHLRRQAINLTSPRRVKT